MSLMIVGEHPDMTAVLTITKRRGYSVATARRLADAATRTCSHFGRFDVLPHLVIDWDALASEGPHARHKSNQDYSRSRTAGRTAQLQTRPAYPHVFPTRW